MIRLFGFLAIFLAISPLFGMLAILLYPPPDPFGGTAPTFTELFVRSRTLFLVANSIALSVSVAFLATVLGGWLAWTEHRCSYTGKAFLQTSGLLVLATPSYILAATLSSRWETLFSSSFQGFFAAVICLTLVCTPYAQLTISAALARISGTEEEAALTLGATSFRAFQVGIWPQIRSSISFSFLISFLYAISDFGAVATLDTPVLTWQLYEAVRTQDLARASLLGVGTLLVTIPIFLWVNRLQGSQQRNHLANPRKVMPLTLSPTALFLTYTIHFSVLLLGLLLPVIELGSWIVDGYIRQQAFLSQWDAIWGSVLLSTLGALLTIALTIAPAWLSVYRSSIYKTTTYLASALPGVLLAFGLMVSCLQITKFTGGYSIILSSGVLLFLGYAMRFMAESFGPIASSIVQFNPRLTETAQTLGSYPHPWFRKVLLPHLNPSVLRSFLIVFLACLKELPITLLLGGATGYKTLAFRTWDRYNEALWHDAGVSGIILLMIALPMTIFTLRWKQHAFRPSVMSSIR